MAYLFKGRLCGYICAECSEALSNVIVRLYRNREEQNVAALVGANAKDTFRVLTPDEVKQKSGDLIAETRTDADGNFTFELGDNTRYGGEAFEIDVYCETVPNAPEGDHEPVQVTLTTVQPAWRKTENGQVAGWEYCIPFRYWCLIRSRFGAWVICGKVVDCETKTPISGVRVRAFDADWLQDDALGSAMTDAQGKFRIYYAKSSFEKTPFSWLGINVEHTSGPDLYFSVETVPGAIVLLKETQADGRKPGRENVGTCFCVTLCVDPKKIPPHTPTELPSVFTKIGGLYYETNVNSFAPGNGRTIGDNRAFFSSLRLNGILSQRRNNNPVEYMFEVRPTDVDGNPLGSWTQVPTAQVAGTQIGDITKFVSPPNPPGSNPVKMTPYFLSNIDFTGDGWIKVPQMTDINLPTGAFAPNNNLINLNTTQLAAFPAIDLTGLVTGQSQTAVAPLAQNKHFAIRMWVREQGIAGSATIGGTCHHIAVENTLYNNILSHPAWSGPNAVSGQLGLAMINVAQLIGGCDEITTQLDVLFTAAHPNLGAVSISMVGGGGTYNFTLPVPANAADQHGTAIPSAWALADLADCAYIVSLSAQLLLTTGDGVPNNVYDQIAYCKHTM
ncbi:MAG: carboxypeptidase regulatory-like domain-containing protein [Candidatus Kapaibacterium sp.]